MIELLAVLRGGGNPGDIGEWLAIDLSRRWMSGSSRVTAPAVEAERLPPDRPRTPANREKMLAQQALANLDDHQRAAIILHDVAGMGADDIGVALDVSPDLAYVQLRTSRNLFIGLAELSSHHDLANALTTVAVDAPRIAIWPEIAENVRERFETERSKQRRLSLIVAGCVGLALIVGAGVVLIWDDSPPDPSATAVPVAAMVTPSAATAFSVLPTTTPTPAADVADTIVVSSRGPRPGETRLLDQRLDEIPLLGENSREAGAPVVAPDGQQVILRWYAVDEQGTTGYIAAYDSELAVEQWRVVVATDPEAFAGDRVNFQISIAVDHERVYLVHHAWRSSELIDIAVLSREDGRAVETIPTNLTGFAAHDVRLHAPPGSNQINLLAITNEAPPETGALQITFLAYAVPGGEKVHGRILFDLPDSRTFFLYESRLILGTETLIGVEHTAFYQQLAVHLFDLGAARLDPKVVLPFQPIANPVPYQQAVSHDGHWLYVLSTATLEVAVFNLFDQSLAGVVPLDIGILAGDEIGISYPQSRTMQISPDGRRMYAEGVADGAPSGIWVIDTVSWTIIDHWMPGTRPGEILLTGDGSTLYARVLETNGGATSDNALVAIDTATGTAEELEVDGAGRFSLASVATLFQRTYASTPSIDGQRQEIPANAEPLAAPRLLMTQTVFETGVGVVVDIQFVHPLTGQPVTETASTSRYSQPDGVRATWTHAGSEQQILLELGRTGYGQYQGVVQLNEPGAWSLQIDLDWPDGTIRDRTLLDQATVRVPQPVTAEGAPPSDAPSG